MKKFLALSLSDIAFIMLINVKMPTIVFSFQGPFYDQGLMLEISEFLSLQNKTDYLNSNNADPDEMLHIPASHLGVHCFLIAHVSRLSNAQHLVEYEKKPLLYEENRESGNVMQRPMDSYICDINTSSGSILIRSYLLLAQQTHSY